MSVIYYRDKDGVFKEVPAIQGKSAYQYAVEGGYEGTEEEFAAALAGVDSAATRAEDAADRTEELLNSYVDEVDALIGGGS
jgi:hypothetical protein